MASPVRAALWAASLALLASQATAQSTTVTRALWPLQTFVTEPDFKPPVFEWQKTGPVESGLILYGPTTLIGAGETSAIITTDEGEMIWQSDPTIAASNLTPGKLHGKPVLHYWAGDLASSIGRGYGYCIILDDTYNVLYNVTLDDPTIVVSDPESGSTVQLDTYIDQHEQYLTDYGTLIVTAYNATPYDLSPIGGPADGWLLDGLIYEIDVETNEILFRWRASDFPEQIPLNGTNIPFSSSSGLGNNVTEAFDYFHHNAIQAFEDGFIISSRHFWTAYYVSKKTGEIIWYMDGGRNSGDFEIGPGANFSWQHDIRVKRTDDDTLLMHMHDNANYATGQHNTTGGLFLEVKEKEKTVSLIKNYYDHQNPVASPAEGSNQPLSNGHVLMEYGIIPSAKEFDGNGNVVWQANYGIEEIQSSYRMYRHSWSGFPTTRPKASACKQSDGKVRVFMSWNGATNYDGWVIYSNSNGGHHRARASTVEVRKSGFETNTTVSAADYITVEAVNCTGMTSQNTWGGYNRHQKPVQFSETVQVNATCSY